MRTGADVSQHHTRYTMNSFYIKPIGLFLSILFLSQCADLPQQEALFTAETFSSSAIGSEAGDSGQETTFPEAPDFTLESMEGENFTLSDYHGQVIVLNIWATWCPPCREEIPHFIEMQDELREDGVLFVGVSIDEEGWEVVRPFAEEFRINYPLVVDDGSIAASYGPFYGIPMSFLINRKGEVEHVAPGMVTKEILQPILVELASRN